MSKTLKLIGVQANSSNNLNSNIKQAINFINNNSSGDIIVFPELYISGYLMESCHLQQNSINFSTLEPIISTASQNNIYVVISFVENNSGYLYNTTALINPEGYIEGVHRKSINWKSELPYIKEGILNNNLQVFPTYIGKLGILTCYEASFPELSRNLAKQGIQLLIVNANWGKDYLHHWKIQLQARALDNNIYVLGVNTCNEYTCGNTMVINPDGQVICSLDNSKEDVLISEINLNTINNISKKTPYLKDSIHYNLETINF